ncbi:MAG TPA: pectin acetylesterase-family hydrolase [Kofleriaceae bacterium]|nr:pectin acetylesterase-family hydrolase [Kofleriaceae bacterium]
MSRLVGALAMAGLVVGCGGGPDEEPILNPPRDAYDTWLKIEPPGVVCGNNTPYKIFVNFSDKSDNLVVVFEPGGACWDYESCTGKNGIRGAANVDGLPDDHWELAPFISPFLSRFDDTNPSREWNMVYVPYCTGDVHTGNTTVTYQDPAGVDPDVTFHHDGHAAVKEVVSWIDSEFTHVPKMLVTGCSAGGVGSLVNYRFLRNGVRAVDKGYLLDDSGPVFPSSGYSAPMHAMIRAAWNLDSLSAEMPAGFTPDDMGTINTALADEFPSDRLATTFFRRDYNFSLYSYERFYNFPPKDEILRMWDADTQLLVSEYETRENLFYFLPYWRDINSSHCTTVLNFTGSDIEDHDMTLAQWVNDFVADKPVESMMEAPVPGEDP